MGFGRVLVVLLAAVCAAVAGNPVANPGRRPFSVLGQDQGLPSPAVMCVSQDADGFIYLGADSGLIRYEGAGAFRMWGLEDGLPSALVHRLLPARNGGLWVATYRGLARFRDGRLQVAALGTEPGASPGSFVEDGHGRLWVLTAKQLYVQKDDLVFEAYPLKLDPRGQSLNGGGRSGIVYLSGKDGILAIQPGGKTRFWGVGDGLPAEGPSMVAEDGLGRVWAGRGRTLVMKEPDGDRFTDQSARLGRSLAPNGVPWVDPDGSLWLPTMEGVIHLMGDQTEVLDEAGGLPFRWARSLFRDREGTLWVVGPAVARLQGAGRIWNYAVGRGNSGEVVWSITRDHQSRLLVGTDDGAARLEAQGLVRIPGSEGRRIKALREDHTGLLWMVSTTGPALWLRPGRTAAEVAPLGDLGTSVNTVTEDSEGRVWLGHSRQGILRWDSGARRLVQEVGPEFVQAAGLGAFGFREDAGKRLWAGTTAGLLIREPDGTWRRFTEKDGLHPGVIHGLDFLPDGSAWIQYQEPVGLTRVRLQDGALQVLEHRTRAQGLRSNLIFALRVDPAGRAWMSSDHGLDRIDPPLHLGRLDGLPTEDCALHALLPEGDRVWVGTSGGLTRYESSEVRGFLPPPRAFILQLTAGHRRLDPPFEDLPPFPASESTLAFRVAAPTYMSDREVRYEARLAGQDDAWREMEGPVALFPSLPGGTFRFEVRAAVGAGTFGPVSSLEVTVRPVWWRTGWATVLWVIIGLAVLRTIVRFRVRALAQAKAELEGLVARRTEELRARNQDLSQALGRVKQLSGLLPICASCKKIRDDKGYWNQLEHYISEHSEAGFSHGICPECVQELYPEFQARSEDKPEEG